MPETKSAISIVTPFSLYYSAWQRIMAVVPKNKLILQRSDDLEVKEKQKKVRVHFIPDIKSGYRDPLHSQAITLKNMFRVPVALPYTGSLVTLNGVVPLPITFQYIH
ncbi:hypothetical protein EO95_09360 [Methanosarcina sp. 1.H.T.1A.1]|uniref:hypothetical protein n=1 Tax=Methanosarcina sp. 1.H.T.1A.1 TaxID=1483602 RepID=UPI0006221184|nr:hypothetical protein [Methanosarcina sp. 1.H.T.1A.1]KKH92875.1 hypothetical protein EO95_09360 [Methanosarcina sp. 1.H.T.1A.1]